MFKKIICMLALVFMYAPVVNAGWDNAPFPAISADQVWLTTRTNINTAFLDMYTNALNGLPSSTDNQILQSNGVDNYESVSTLDSVVLNMGADQSSLLYDTGSNFLLDTDTSVNHVLSASKIIALIASSSGATIIDGTSALGTSSVASGTCATVVTTTATGVVTTDSVEWSFNADPTAVTGYSPSTDGMLTIIVYPTAGNVNFKVCNNLAAAVTPGAVTLNWRVVQ